MDANEIRELLASGLDDCEVELQMEGNKIAVRLVSDSFEGLSRVRRQQLVYGLLNDRISSGEIHAVTMKTLTRTEFAASR